MATLTKYKLGELVKWVSKSVLPQQGVRYHLYSLPSFDNDQMREEVYGEDILSNKLLVPNKCILFNKLNVRFKRVWRIDNDDESKLASTEFLPLVVNEMLIDYQYCYYLLISDYITNYLCGQNTNTSGSHKRIDPTDFLNIEVSLPEYEEQVKIGRILTAIDQKIAVNRAINHNLPSLDRSSATATVHLAA